MFTKNKIYATINIYLRITIKTMEKVDKKLFEKKDLKKELMEALDSLKTEEVLLFKDSEKEFKSTVYVVVNNYFKYVVHSEKKFSIKRNNMLCGWLIKRIK